VTLVSQMELGKRSPTGGLRDWESPAALRHMPPGTPDGTRTDCPQAAHLVGRPNVRITSLSHQPAVMAITSWSIQARRPRNAPGAERTLRHSARKAIRDLRPC
jgi:hypothetical protein